MPWATSGGRREMATDTWGGHWGTSWLQHWFREVPVVPPAAPGGIVPRRRRRQPELRLPAPELRFPEIEARLDLVEQPDALDALATIGEGDGQRRHRRTIAILMMG